MAVTFPSSPANGDQFTAGNKVFQRFGTRWRRVAGIVVWESGTAPNSTISTDPLDEIDGGNA
jgi:hypothetical protein